MNPTNRTLWRLLVTATLGAAMPAAAATPATKPSPAGKPAPAAKAGDATAKPAAVAKPGGEAPDMTLKGGEDGTVFRSLTVEGEDRIHIEVERPKLQLDLDPERAPGLEWGTARDVLDRTTPDFNAPLLAATSVEASPHVARPWLDRLATGPVARFRPEVRNVERWKLTVVDARAEAVASFSGQGNPPEEIVWDGRTASGGAVRPGVTYSYVFEARDRAGNRRNFVGQGFRVSTFRSDGTGGPLLVFAGTELPPATRGAADEPVPPIVLEAATALNQAPAAAPLRIEVTARTSDQASAIAQRLARWLTPLLVGDPARLQSVTQVQPDAPDGGAIRISPVR